MKKTKAPSPFKLSHFNDKVNANAGATMWLKDPRTGEEYDHEHNLYIILVGRASDIFEASLTKEKENRESKDYKKPETDDEKRDENVRLYSSFVIGYGQGLYDELGGAYTEARAAQLLATCDSICMDVINFATNRSNFIQG